MKINLSSNKYAWSAYKYIYRHTQNISYIIIICIIFFCELACYCFHLTKKISVFLIINMHYICRRFYMLTYLINFIFFIHFSKIFFLNKLIFIFFCKTRFLRIKCFFLFLLGLIYFSDICLTSVHPLSGKGH